MVGGATPGFYKKQASKQDVTFRDLCTSSCLQIPAFFEFLSWLLSMMNSDVEV